ncbi:MAG TPA: Nif3-like dinuclear metal center hexameric protein [Spirochaetota bacterium]|nr:Nif3-like dinuclear metal center hexameric protein [Spirochaetota bacterium]
MDVKQVAEIMNSLFPLHLQEEYDNAGGQVLFPDGKVSSILIALDLDTAIIEEAVEKKCSMIITHHPFFFRPVKQISSADPKSALLISLIDTRISLYAAHTNLDKVFYNKLGASLGMPEGTVLFSTDSGVDTIPAGLGMVSDLPEPSTLNSLLPRVKKALGIEFLVYAGDPERLITRVALLNGAGGGSIEKIIRTAAPDCIITGDVGYHNVKAAIDSGTAVIDAGHYGTEKILLSCLKDALSEQLNTSEEGKQITLHITERERNPFQVFV